MQSGKYLDSRQALRSVVMCLNVLSGILRTNWHSIPVVLGAFLLGVGGWDWDEHVVAGA